MPKRLELLSELVPRVQMLALLVNPENPQTEGVINDMQQAARAKGVQLHILHVATAPIYGHHRGPRGRLADCSKIRTYWKMVIIFDHLAAPWSRADVRGTAPQFCGPKLIDTGHSCSDRRCPVRAFDDSTARPVGGRRLARTRPEASRAGWRLRRATGSSALFSRR